jgi:hypothetical protein
MMSGRLLAIVGDFTFDPNVSELTLQQIPHTPGKLGNRKDRSHVNYNLQDIRATCEFHPVRQLVRCLDDFFAPRSRRPVCLHMVKRWRSPLFSAFPTEEASGRPSFLHKISILFIISAKFRQTASDYLTDGRDDSASKL